MSWGDSYKQWQRKRAITNELKILLYKRKQSIKKIAEQHPTSVIPFVRSGHRRWWRIRKIKTKAAILTTNQRIKRKLKFKRQQKRKVVMADISEMDHLGQVVQDANNASATTTGTVRKVEWDENYQSEVKNLKIVTRPKLSRKEIKKIFVLYDTDGGGTIDRNELQVLAYSLGEIWDNEKLDSVMKEIDTDGKSHGCCCVVVLLCCCVMLWVLHCGFISYTLNCFSYDRRW